MFEAMVFMILFFVGIVAVLWYLIVKIENVSRQASEERAQLRVLLRAMESRLDGVSRETVAPERGEPMNDGTDERTTAYDPLLRLNFDEPPTPEEDFGRQKLELNIDLPSKN